MFRLRVEFLPRFPNGDADFGAKPIIWEEAFDDWNDAVAAFMTMRNCLFDRCDTDNLKPCPMRGALLDRLGVMETPQSGVCGVSLPPDVWSWNWGHKEAHDICQREWARVKVAKVPRLDPARQICETCVDVFKWLDDLAESGKSGSDVRMDASLLDNLVLVDLLVQLGLCSSKNDARRQIQQRGVRVNGVVVETIEHCLNLEDVVNGEIQISRGKKEKRRLKVE